MIETNQEKSSSTGQIPTALAHLNDLIERIEERLGGCGTHPRRKIYSARKEMTITQPKLLVGGELKDYQVEALNWMVQLASKQLNGILADDMGLGKTIQAIAYFAYLQEEHGISGKHLVCCPKNVMKNWEREINKWLPSVRPVVLQATQKEREETLDKKIRTKKFDIVITSYQGLVSAYKTLSRVKWETFIMDQAHKIKNDKTILATYARGYKCKFKLLLTGTPLSNNLHDLWSLLYFAVPDIFDDECLFDEIEESVNAISDQESEKFDAKVEIAKKFHQIIYPFILRRTKAETDLGLPPKTQKTIFAPMTKLQLTIYKNLLKYKIPFGQSGDRMNNITMQLRKVCNHPYMFQGVEPSESPELGDHLIEASGKMRVMHKLVEKLLKEGHKILIFSQFTTQLDIIEDYCRYMGYQYSRIDGSTSIDDREREIESFDSGISNMFLLSTKAGGLGINLVSADRVIIYDIDWNPQNDNQAMDRAYRIGQTRPVHVFKLITEYSIEERMLEVQKYKLIWDELVIQKGLVGKKKEDIMGKINFDQIAQLGKGDIFRLTGTYDDKTIEELIEIGDEKDDKKNQQIKEKLMKQIDQDSINPFDVEIEAPTAEEMKYCSNVVFQKKEDDLGLKNKYLRVDLPFYQLYPNRNQLELLMGRKKKLDAIQEKVCLGQAELEKYQILVKQISKQEAKAFPDWTEEQYESFCEANLQNIKNDYEQIAKAIGSKTEKEVKAYSRAYFERAYTDWTAVAMFKKIEKYQESRQIELRKETLLQWQATHKIIIGRPRVQLRRDSQGNLQGIQSSFKLYIYTVCEELLGHQPIQSEKQLFEEVQKNENTRKRRENEVDGKKKYVKSIQKYWKHYLDKIESEKERLENDEQLGKAKIREEKLMKEQENQQKEERKKKATSHPKQSEIDEKKDDSNQTKKAGNPKKSANPKLQKVTKKQGENVKHKPKRESVSNQLKVE